MRLELPCGCVVEVMLQYYERGLSIGKITPTHHVMMVRMCHKHDDELKEECIKTVELDNKNRLEEIKKQLGY